MFKKIIRMFNIFCTDLKKEEDRIISEKILAKKIEADIYFYSEENSQEISKLVMYIYNNILYQKHDFLDDCITKAGDVSFKYGDVLYFLSITRDAYNEYSYSEEISNGSLTVKCNNENVCKFSVYQEDIEPSFLRKWSASTVKCDILKKGVWLDNLYKISELIKQR